MPDAGDARRGLDADRFDAIADHLVVVDLERGEPAAARASSAATGCCASRWPAGAAASTPRSEFDLGGRARADGEIMELGRSCVEPEYRSGTVMQLLWRGIADYHRRPSTSG